MAMDKHTKALLKNLKSAKVLPQVQQSYKNGTPLVTLLDVFKTPHILARLFRAIAAKEGITLEEIRDKNKIMLAKREVDPSTFATANSNLIANITKPTLSFNKFITTIIDVLGYDLDIHIVLSKDGKTTKYEYKELMNEISKG